ncbi:conserved hypothetical protein [Pyrenophora tritici-repentis Pt-1C-BFP]|uniref:Uncharacterized protein n=1 Tax=Pyrenophora tritici-repentis (strain Pt-1C-BFP) TaxID=426418 RepID=B2W8Z5_PYRTR|nr:uncharacterized protein PTRG_06453 [Pyrenophora tritici-repentis Pt-1C-BFP]EDU49373.1 conserved hypothetical protein [Pyrenophora tritici-repentis Pt-1C-BFP]
MAFALGLYHSILEHFCAIVILSTTGFVVWYWVEVILITFRMLFYWIYELKVVIKHEDLGRHGALFIAMILRFYDKLEGLGVPGVYRKFLDAVRVSYEALNFLLYVFGFRIGGGPLFECLPEEMKAARRACKTPAEVDSFFAVFAGTQYEESENKEDDHDQNDEEEACFPPSVFECQPNPVIFHHLRDEHLPLFNPGPSEVESRKVIPSTPDMAVDFDCKDTTENDEQSPNASRHTGPATMSVNLSYACSQCNYVAKKKFELKYARIPFPMSAFTKRW